MVVVVLHILLAAPLVVLQELLYLAAPIIQALPIMFVEVVVLLILYKELLV